MKKIYFLLAICAFSYQGYAQPANDDCANATELTVNTDEFCGSIVSGTLAGATDSGEGDNGAGLPNDDVWYTFVATATAHIINITNVSGTPTDLVHEVLEGTCGGGLTSFALTDDPDYSTVTGLTVGNTYYLRIYSYRATAAESTTFDLCIATPPPPPDAPANDDCDNAVELTINTDELCGVVTSGTLAGATNSNEGDNGAGMPNDDVWYTFVASATSHTINITNVSGSPTDIVHEVLEGTCGGGLTSVSLTDDPDYSTLYELTVGNTYYLRIFSYQSDPAESTTFDLCLGTPPPPPDAPANDDCNNAVEVTPNADNECENVIAGTLSGATNSGEGDNGGGNPNDDVWYTFVATNATHIFRLLNVEGEVTDLMHEVMQGTCGGGLESLSLSDPNTSVVSDLVIGNTYYVRVFSYQNAPSMSTDFSLCIGSAPAAPENDDCNNAVAITPNADNNCETVTTGTLSGATDSGEGDNGGGVPNDDVWYTFVATASTHIFRLLNVTGDTTDLMHEVMEGTCGGGLAMLNLSDPNTSTVSNLVIGNTYYVRVFSYQATPSLSTNFSLCIGSAPSAPANDDCDAAVTLTANADDSCTSNASGTLSGATNSGEGDNGAGLPSDDVWYTFVATSEIHTFSVYNVTGDTTDLVHEVMQGTCGGGLSTINISDPNNSTVSSLVVGNTYYVRVFSYQTAPSISTNFSICVGTPPPPPANDECAGAVTLTVGNSYAAAAINASVASATDSNNNATIPAPMCPNGYAGGDVWFTTVIPESGSLIIETGDSLNGISGLDTVVAAYTGSCEELTSLSCDDDGADTGNYSKLSISNRTPGEVIFIRVYEYNNDNSVQFSISAYDTNLATTSFDASSFAAYPNPVTDVLNLSYTKNISNVEVYNLVGQQLIAKSVNNREDKVDMSHLSAGTYLVRVTAEGQTKTIKVIKR